VISQPAAAARLKLVFFRNIDRLNRSIDFRQFPLSYFLKNYTFVARQYLGAAFAFVD
jgi:hypothetical protein